MYPSPLPAPTFASQARIGKVGEEIFTRNCPSDAVIMDVRHVPAWQKRDIDYIVDGATYEIKTDTYATQNLFLEVMSHGRPGCVFQTRADYLVYVMVALHVMLTFPTATLQEWLFWHGMEYPLKTLRNGESTGVVVPIAVLEHLVYERVHIGE